MPSLGQVSKRHKAPEDAPPIDGRLLSSVTERACGEFELREAASESPGRGKWFLSGWYRFKLSANAGSDVTQQRSQGLQPFAVEQGPVVLRRGVCVGGKGTVGLATCTEGSAPKRGASWGHREKWPSPQSHSTSLLPRAALTRPDSAWTSLGAFPERPHHGPRLAAGLRSLCRV